MTDKQLFAAFSEEEQEQYARQAEAEYDPETVRASNRRWKALSAAEKQRILDEGNRIYSDLIAAIPSGPASPEAQASIQRWRTHLDYFWTPSLDQLICLADGYRDDPRFRANFDRMDPRLAEFMQAAVTAYVKSQE